MNRPSLLPFALLLLLLATPAAAQCGVTTRVSLGTGGTQLQGASQLAIMTPDGRYMFFIYSEDDLVAGDTNGFLDVFRMDLVSGETLRASQDSNGVGGNTTTFSPLSASDDGRYVAFNSFATNLVPGDTNGVLDVFVHDFQTRTTRRVSVGDQGQQGNGHATKHGLSADGRFVAFDSEANNLIPGDTNGQRDVFVLELASGNLLRVSLPAGGGQGDGQSNDPRLSADGSVVAFTSFATNLVAGDTNNRPDIFVTDLTSSTIERVSVDSNGIQGDGRSEGQEISPDGRFVFFDSRASNLVPGDTNNRYDVFLRDRQAGSTRRVSVGPNGEQANGLSSVLFGGEITPDGRYALFYSEATNLVPGDTNVIPDIFHKDLESGRIARVSVSSTGEQAAGMNGNGAHSGSMTSDGARMLLDSPSENLVPGDTNGRTDIFMHTLWEAPESFCLSSPNSSGAAARMATRGNPSIASGGLELSASSLPNTAGLFFFGAARIQVPFGNGTRCVGGPQVRRFAPSSVSAGALERTIDYQSGAGTSLQAGATWHFQAWFRDPAAGGAAFDLSDGVSVTFCP